MSIIIAINKILDIKIVQWALLGLVVLLSVGILVGQIRYNGLKLQHALLETKYTKISAASDIQNSKIEEANKMYLQYKTNFEQAQKKINILKQTNEENKLKLNSFQFKPNSTCDEKVNQTLIQYLNMVRK